MDEFDRLLNEYSIACASEGAAAAHSRDSDMLDEQVELEAALRAHVAALLESYDAVNATREAQASIALDWQNKAAALRDRAEKAEAKLARVRECVAFPVDGYRLAVNEVRDVLGDGDDE